MLFEPILKILTIKEDLLIVAIRNICTPIYFMGNLADFLVAVKT